MKNAEKRVLPLRSISYGTLQLSKLNEQKSLLSLTSNAYGRDNSNERHCVFCGAALSRCGWSVCDFCFVNFLDGKIELKAVSAFRLVICSQSVTGSVLGVMPLC